MTVALGNEAQRAGAAAGPPTRARADEPAWWAAAALGAGLLFVAAVWLAARAKGVPVGALVRDPNQIAGQPFYYGVIVYAEIVILATAAGTSLAVAALLARLRRGSRRLCTFLAAAGLLSLVLAGDDALQLHENAWRLGLAESHVFAIYGALAAAMVAAHTRIVAGTSYSLALAAAGCFAAAVGIDSVPGLGSALPTGTEDLMEFAGICLWAAYLAKSGFDGAAGALAGDAPQGRLQ